MVLYLNAFSPIFITSGSLIIILIISLENMKITIDHIKEYKVVILNCTQNLGHKIGGCSFFMSKLTREDKIEIYERRKKGETISSLANSFYVSKSTIEYLIALIKKHGYDILRNGKNRYYSKEFKLQTINRVLVNFESVRQVAIDIGLASDGILHNWLSKFKENGYNVVEKKKGRKSKSMTKPKKSDKILLEKDKIKQLEDEIIYLKAENEYLKKLRALVQERELKEKKK